MVCGIAVPMFYNVFILNIYTKYDIDIYDG